MGVTILRDAQELLTKEKLEKNISFKLLDIGGDLSSSISQISESFTCNYLSINNNQKQSKIFDLNVDSLYSLLKKENFDAIVLINVLEHLENPINVINQLFEAALEKKTNKILISSPFLPKDCDTSYSFYKFSSNWFLKQFYENKISQEYSIEVIGIGGGLLKYLFSFIYEKIKPKNYFKKIFLPIIRSFLNDELKSSLKFPVGYYITLTRKT